jgi:hypothetical protein
MNCALQSEPDGEDPLLAEASKLEDEFYEVLYIVLYTHINTAVISDSAVDCGLHQSTVIIA